MKGTIRQLTAILLCVVLCISFSPMSAGAENAELLDTSSGTCGDNLTWTLESPSGQLTISGTGAMYDWSEGSRPWPGYRVRRVVIENGVTSIGKNAFSYCSNLTNISIPDSVTAIGNSAFRNCSSLTEITIPNAVTSIGGFAFYGCSGLLSLAIPAGVTSIADYLCCGCSGLANIIIPGGVTSIGYSAFSGCSSLTALVIPEGVTSIDVFAFYNCSSLISLTVPGSVTAIGQTTFAGCSGLKSAGPVGSGSGYEFGWAEEIPDNAFRGCSAISRIQLPDTLTTVGKAAFLGCSSLTDITIPGRVSSIGDEAFGDCISLTAVNVAAGSGSYCSADGVLFNTDKTRLLYYPAGKAGISYTIPDTVKSIDGYAFAGCKLTKVQVPGSVTKMGSYVFSDCTGLTSAGPAGSGCGIEFGWTTRIPQAAFYGCGSLESVKIPDSVTSIGGWAFVECKSLTGIAIPDGVTKINDCTFSGCSSLTAVAIPERVTSILSSAFAGCSSLVSITIPDGVTVIDDYAFSRCRSLTDFTIPVGVTSIGNYAFYGCCSLTEISIPDGVTSIGRCAFQYSGIKSAVIPGSVSELGQKVFANCPSLSDVYYGGQRSEWNTLSDSADLNSVNLFAAEDYDEALTADITKEEVPGGVKVSMSTASGTIYYTLDGTLPCTASIPYEAPFLLEEAGDIFINAVVIDRTEGTYGDVVTEYVDLERSDVPEVYELNGAIHMDGTLTKPGGIYYCFDLTTEPTAASDKYVNPVLLSETKVIRARVIETGKAPSALVSYAFYMTSGGIAFPDDSYSFPNTAASFGYGNAFRIGEVQYGEIFGSTAGHFLYNIYNSRWGGSCFGMSATALMFSDGVLNPGDYSGSAQNVNGIAAPRSRESELTRLIERYQVAQFLPEMVKERNDISSGGNMVISGLSSETAGDSLLPAVQKACTGGEPIILILWKNGLNGSYAVVPYRLQNGKIYIYDSNRPNEERILTYTKDSESGSYRFSYGEYSYAVSYNTLNTLLSGLEGLQTGQVSLTAGGKEQMLVSLNTNSFRILDEAGNEVADYTVCRATEDMAQSVETVLYLDEGTYTVLNADNTLAAFSLSAATAGDYCSVTVNDPSAQIRIGVEYSHLSVTITCDRQASMTFRTLNSSSVENTIGLTAEYAKVSACTDLATLVETTVSSITGNGETIALTQENQGTTVYFGMIGESVTEEARDAYDGSAEIRLSTDIAELLDESFTLTASVTGAGETAIVYAASYDVSGQMTTVQSRETQAGKTKYPFTIEASTAEVKIYVLDKNTSKPLTVALTIQ